jgi:hypothetical protein
VIFGSLVPIPVTDRTPPTVTLNVPYQVLGQIVLGTNSAPVTISMDNGANFFVVAVSEDPEGVKQVGFSGSSTLICKQGNIGSNQYADLQGPTNTDNGASGTALTRRWLPTFVDDTYLRCSAGWSRVSATLTLQAEGQNFGGGSGHSASASFVWH